MIWSLSMAVHRRRDDIWLSLTPEPERLLPEARAVLRSGARAAAARAASSASARSPSRSSCAPARERWEAWLRESAALAAAADAEEPETAAARALVHDVVANHDALALGLPHAERLH